MKKLFMLCAAGLLIFQVKAQQTKLIPDNRSFLSFSAGISVPILCYGSSNIDKNTSGFAKAGFIVNIHYGYRWGQNLGISASAFYASNTAKTIVQSQGNDQYSYVGLLAGPLVTTKLFPKTEGDFSLMAGVAHAWSPHLMYQDQTILNKDNSTAFTWSASAAMRYHLSDNTFILLKADHTQLKPKFHGPFTGENVKGEQHIVVMNFDAGLGIKF